jgi:hypothetical protein
MSDTQVIHQLLSQLGIKLTLHWSRSVPGYVGEKLRTYVLDQEHWSQMAAVLERREAKRQRLQERGSEGVVSGSPVSFEVVKEGGDPDPEELDGLTLASRLQVLAAVRIAMPPSVLSPTTVCSSNKT